jgi:hypothetical protein
VRVYEYEVLSLIDDTVFDLLEKSPLLIETAILDGQDGPVLLFGAGLYLSRGAKRRRLG